MQQQQQSVRQATSFQQYQPQQNQLPSQFCNNNSNNSNDLLNNHNNQGQWFSSTCNLHLNHDNNSKTSNLNYGGNNLNQYQPTGNYRQNERQHGQENQRFIRRGQKAQPPAPAQPFQASIQPLKSNNQPQMMYKSHPDLFSSGPKVEPIKKLSTGSHPNINQIVHPGHNNFYFDNYFQPVTEFNRNVPNQVQVNHQQNYPVQKVAQTEYLNQNYLLGYPAPFTPLNVSQLSLASNDPYSTDINYMNSYLKSLPDYDITANPQPYQYINYTNSLANAMAPNNNNKNNIFYQQGYINSHQPSQNNYPILKSNSLDCFNLSHHNHNNFHNPMYQMPSYDNNVSLSNIPKLCRSSSHQAIMGKVIDYIHAYISGLTSN